MAEDSASPQTDDKAALQQVFTLLKTQDDTSRFVGLSLLRSLLDGKEHLRSDENVVKDCWEAVPNKFLIRLMKSGNGQPTEELRSMNSLAVAVVHIFTNLLSPDQVSGKKILELCAPLVKVTPVLEAAPQMLAFQTLQNIVGSAAGAHTFARAGGHKELAGPMVLGAEDRYAREYLKLYDIAWSAAHQEDAKRFILQAVTDSMRDAQNTATLLDVIAGISPQLTFLGEPQPIQIVICLIQKSIMMRPTSQVRNAAIKLASEVLRRVQPSNMAANALFTNQVPESARGDKPFAYVFLQYVLVDLRATIPTLITNLASTTYQNDSLRLAACYDIVAAFIMYLIQSTDVDDMDITEGSKPSTMPIGPDLLLKLRRDLNETFSLTLEFFRDRWDAVTAGAAGLDPSARMDPKSPAMLTWDNPAIAPEQDPIILSGLRALSLWLREDENPGLHKQTIGIADMLAALYKESMKADAKTDFRHPILVLLEGLLSASDEAVQMLLDHDGWDLFASDLRQTSQSSQSFATYMTDLIRVLLIIVTSDAVPQSREAWMEIPKWVSHIDIAQTKDTEAFEVLAELYQLANAIWAKAPKRLQRAAEKEMKQIAMNALSIVNHIDATGADQGLVDSFKEVVSSMGS
ncbi:uncharacterized protein PV09_06277 [Verruconis gallopava]|uniref:DUF1941 family protein n=1 Tax=Verruconis gallopava TaxID=253628 RepID=A0A0D1XJJ7_9PEZI|nr:uncharacterized protein PV09_06277 [Verruconis gallopava]KIW02471.1 hypothetical protein PV09_06277 [Verruconis gallopava]